MLHHPIVKVKQIDGQLVNWFEQQKLGSMIGTVHSIFDKVINFISNDGTTLFSIAVNKVIQSPKMMKTCQTEDFLATKITLKPSMPIYFIGSNQLKIGSWIWDYAEAARWERDIHSLSPISATHDEKNVNKNLQQIILENGVEGGMLAPWKAFIDADPSGLDDDKNIYAKLLLKNLKCLETSLHEKELMEALSKFVGLGAGLTPSGDDFLTGAIATWKYYRFPLWESTKKQQAKWLANMKQRTTVVSYFMLENCVHGFVNEALLQLLENLEQQPEEQMREMIKIGSTSGTDMLTGVSFAYEHLFLSRFNGLHIPT